MRKTLFPIALILVAGTGLGCGAGHEAAAPLDAGADLAPTSALVRARPYNFDVPAGYDGSQAAPLVLLLHGYSAGGVVQRAYFGLGDLVDKAGFFLVYPDGTRDSRGNQFWNATDACCDFDHRQVDDVAYLDAVLDDMRAHYRIDPRRIFVTGHSNGGFMAHRYACDRAETVAAIAALAGDDWKDTTRCKPTSAVAVLQVHGDGDQVVPYLGSALEPSARDSVAGWASLDQCGASGTDTTQPPLDLVSDLPGAETTRERWTGCARGGAAELWTIHGGGHVPSWNYPAWPEGIWTWLAAHPRP